MNVLTLQREVFKPALYLPAVVLSTALVLGILLLEITLNQGLAIVFGITILTIWQYDKVYGLSAALVFFLIKPFWLRLAYHVDSSINGSPGFDLLGLTPALLIVGFIITHCCVIIGSNRRLCPDGTRRWLMVFTVISFASIFYPTNDLIVGLGGFERNVLPNMLILFLAADIFKSQRDIRILLCTLLWVGIVSVLYGLGQFMVGIYPWEVKWFQEVAFAQNTAGWLTIGLRGIEFRIFSIFYYRTDFYFTNVLIFTLLYAGNMFSAGPARWLKYLYYLIWIVMMLITLERTPFIMSMLAVAVVFLFQTTPRRRKIFLISVGVLLIGSYSTLVLGESYLKNSGVSSLIRLAELTNPLEAGSIHDRADNYWGPSIEHIKENPMGLGIGQGSGTKASGRVSLTATGNIRTHNEILQKALETGILGVVAFIILMITVFRDSLRLRRLSPEFSWLGTGVASVTLVFCLSSMITLTFSGGRGLVYWTLAGIVLAMLKQNANNENKKTLGSVLETAQRA